MLANSDKNKIIVANLWYFTANLLPLQAYFQS